MCGRSCQLVVLLAEARIGAELKAAQQRGEVAAKGTNQHPRTSGTRPATLPAIGIPSQRAAEMKKLAEAGEGRPQSGTTEVCESESAECGNECAPGVPRLRLVPPIARRMAAKSLESGADTRD